MVTPQKSEKITRRKGLKRAARRNERGISVVERDLKRTGRQELTSDHCEEKREKHQRCRARLESNWGRRELTDRGRYGGDGLSEGDGVDLCDENEEEVVARPVARL